jgi:hypothetical protein
VPVGRRRYARKWRKPRTLAPRRFLPPCNAGEAAKPRSLQCLRRGPNDASLRAARGQEGRGARMRRWLTGSRENEMRERLNPNQTQPCPSQLSQCLSTGRSKCTLRLNSSKRGPALFRAFRERGHFLIARTQGTAARKGENQERLYRFCARRWMMGGWRDILAEQSQRTHFRACSGPTGSCLAAQKPTVSNIPPVSRDLILAEQSQRGNLTCSGDDVSVEAAEVEFAGTAEKAPGIRLWAPQRGKVKAKGGSIRWGLCSHRPRSQRRVLDANAEREDRRQREVRVGGSKGLVH